ncbi:MAG: phytase [Xenococcaceae cyanobacterium]
MPNIEDIRFASFNTSLNRNTEGELIEDLSTPDNAQAKAVAEIIQRSNPDVILLNEFDYDSEGKAISLFQENYLSISQNGVDPVEYPYVYLAPSNSGIPSGLDLDNDGTTDGAGDAFGFGFFPGQFGMVLLSKYPIDTENIRTFQNFLWQDMPGALLPDDINTPEPQDWYSAEELEVFRLSSKSHWDIPIEINGETIHVLASHPTPPVFDGEEDRNGRRNHDEIRFWADYITPGKGSYIYDDKGSFGGLAEGKSFVIAGDLNADPFDGDSTDNAILQILDNPLVNTSVTPSSEGGVDAANRQHEINDTHQGNPAFDTADFNDNSPGNLRVDYVLPSEDLEITDAEVFWGTSDNPLFELVGDFDPNLEPTGFPSSDHRLVYTDVKVEPEKDNNNRATMNNIDFLGEVSFPTGLTFADTEVGGISGLTYDAANNIYYALSDDRGNINDARFYDVAIDLSDGSLDEGDIQFQDVTTLLNVAGNPFTAASVDPEGIALTSEGTLFISSEGDANNLIAPFVAEFSLGGQIFNQFPVPEKFLPTVDGSSGIRNNNAFESLTITPDNRFLYTALENALIQDGAEASLEEGSSVRILQYDLETGKPAGEFLYFTDPIAAPPDPADSFANNGLVELLAIDNTGTFLALERSFSAGVGNNLKLYEVNIQGATDISNVQRLTNRDGELKDVDAVAEKRLLLDFSDLGIQLDNSEAVSFGSTLPDGRQSLIIASDNNFSDSQITQFLAFGLDIETIPSVSPTLETPDEIRFSDRENPDPNNAPDADDPAIYVHPDNPEESFVITTFKNGGLRVYDLAGEETQSITPENIRYNNVDVAYGVKYTNQLGQEASIDLAIASDRAKDTIAVFIIDPATQQLTKLDEGFEFPESIFGVDDGEATAYGLATYNSLVDGKTYVFVSQADGNKIAQLEITPTFGAADETIVNAKIVRMLDVPVPEGENPEDFQVKGMVVDRETGILYLGQEDFGIWRVDAEVNGSNNFTLVDTVTEDRNLEQTPFSNLVVFGDSLSDTGNLFNLTGGLIPPSPPYFEGRLSNGDLLVDKIADFLELPENESFLTGGNNYAVAGAQTGEGTAEFGLFDALPQPIEVPNVGQQVDFYLAGNTPAATDLFYIFAGGNDFINALLEGETLPTSAEIVANITNDITELAEAGAKSFIVPNLPNVGDIPLFLGQLEAQALLNAATEDFNQLLDTELDEIAEELNITIIEPDINTIVDNIRDNPADFGLTNTTDGVLNLENLSLQGNPEEFFYWDIIHPTATANDLIAEELLEILPSGTTQFATETPSLVPDVEGLTIYYGEDSNGYLLASSQGDSTFAIYDRAGSNSYLEKFAIDNVEESDGADVINLPLGDKFSAGLLVVQDGSNEPAVVFPDPEDGEIQNFNTNFKYVSLADFADILPEIPAYNPNNFDPRNPQANTLINGVASGDTTQDSTVLWARSTVPGTVTFEYSTDADFSDIVGTVEGEITETNLPVKVAIEGLEAGTDYYYRVTDAAGDSLIGEFTTFAEVGEFTGLRFGVSGDWRGELAPYPAISNADERDLAFFVEHGDTIYADIASDAVKNPDGTRKSQAETIDEYRAKHSEVYSSRLGLNTWADLRASTSILATIDDHEVTNDFAGGADVSTDDRFAGESGLINDTELFENGLQTFQEYNPLRDEFYGETGDEVTAGERKLYRFNTYGSDAATFVLDSRSFRDESLTPPADISDPEEIARVLTESITLDRTLLGEAQLNDLKQDLLTAEASGITWKFVMLPEPAQNLFPGINVDSYEGYLHERAEILSFVEDNDIDNVVFVAADVHMTAVNNLTYQTEPFGEQIATSVFEVTTGAVAFDEPTGELLGNLFTASDPELAEVYNSLPVAPDTDDIVDDRDDFVKQAINNTLLTPLGFDPLGLDNNLPQAEGLINAELIQGDYYVGHTYGWTEFDIDESTQQLRVTTYGIDAYSEDELLANPNEIINLTPQIVSEFVVNPVLDNVFGTPENDILEVNGENNSVFAGEGNDLIDLNASLGNNQIFGEKGNDTFILGVNDVISGGVGSDRFFTGSGGNNTLTGGEDLDEFWIATAEIPDAANTITDFEIGIDVLGIAGLSIGFNNLDITRDGDNSLISFEGQNLAILLDTNPTSLNADNFVFV